MTSFCLAFAAGIGILCSLTGWGWLIIQLLGIQKRQIGYYATLGLALSTSVGGLLNSLHAISPAVIVIYLSAGLLLAVVAAVSGARLLREQARSAWTYFKGHRLIALVAAVVIVLCLFKYSIAVSPGRFHPLDDYQGYFVFPLKMIQTGSLGPDPFSERRIQSSLGGQEFLDTFPLSLTGETRNLHLLDAGVAFLILIFLVLEIMLREKLRARWIMLILLSCALFSAPASNITAVYTGTVLIVLFFDCLSRRETQPSLAQAAQVALLLASLVALKTTFVPVAALAWLGYALLLIYRSPFRTKAIVNAAFCAGLTGLLLLPWMLDSYRSSGTFFYPFFGRGYHGSRYGTYLLPTAQLGIQNLLAFFHGTQDVLFAILATQVVLLLIIKPWKESAARTSGVIASIVVASLTMIASATAAYQVFRYSFPVVFAGVIYLLVQQMAGSKPNGDGARPGFYSETASLLLGALLLGGAFQGFALIEQDRLDDLKFALTGANIDSAGEVAAYHAMQSSVPAGQTMLVFLDKHYLFDFRRNLIYVNDTPGGASLPPGMPAFKGPEALANYLLSVGVRYLAYSYADQADFSRAEYGGRLNPNVNVNFRVGAQIAFDFEDNVSQLGKTRKRVFDDGKMFVLDLKTRVNEPGVTASTAHVDRLAAPSYPETSPGA